MGHNHENVVSGLITDKDLCKIREAVCIQTEKIYDSCKERDCIEDAKVIFKHMECAQKLIDAAINVKCRRAEVLDVFADIEPVPFKRGFFTVDIKFFILVTLDFFIPTGTGSGPAGTTIVTRTGLVVFDKKVILFGSEGNVKIFKSKFVEHDVDTQIHSNLQQDNLPIAKVEVAEPICLNARIQDLLDKLFDDCCMEQFPRHVAAAMDDNDEDEIQRLVGNATRHGNQMPTKRVVVTIGLFSIIKLARFVQLLIPAFDFCVPNKECIAATEENPCELFETIEFPVEEFFPPQMFDFPGATEQEAMMHEMEHDHFK
jgi:hypothetical protein